MSPHARTYLSVEDDSCVNEEQPQKAKCVDQHKSRHRGSRNGGGVGHRRKQ
uniref:Uncharacterized protein n=1 Tax=Arundo donax TaxID=35708 RepID=A0A0A8YYL8_ARUDO